MGNEVQRQDAGGKDAYNTYYMRVALWYRNGKWILLLLFTLYLTLMMLSYRESMTYENVLYLLRDFNVSSSADGGFSSVVYEEQPNMTFASYKGELVVAGSSEIVFFDGNGGATLRDASECQKPILESGDKYLLVYDEGGSSYALYTAIARVMRGSTDSPIQSGAVSDTGMFAIASRSHESKYLVTLYSPSLRQIASYYRDNYVTGVTLSSDGEYLAIFGISGEDASMDGVVTLCSTASAETVDVALPGRIPLSASFLNGDTLAVVTDSAVCFFDTSGREKSIFPFSSLTLTHMHFTDTRVAVACSEDVLGTSSRVFVLDSDGNTVAESVRSEKILSVTASDGPYAAYVQGQDSLLYLAPNAEESTTASLSGNLLKICEISALPVFCFPTEAQTADS